MIEKNIRFLILRARFFGGFAFLYYFCTVKRKNNMPKFNLQIVTAALLAIGGLLLLFCGVYIDPQGEIHKSLLIGFGEVATFAGALFGIDAAYSKKLWEYIRSIEKNPTEKPSEGNSTTATSKGKQTIVPLPKPSKTQTTSSPPDDKK